MKKSNSKKVISRRNAGLGDLLLATAHAWYYANKTKRDLEICWAPSMYFKDKSINAFGRIFNIPDKIGNVKIICHDRIGLIKRLMRRLPVFPSKYFIRTLLIEFIIKFLKNRIPAYIKNARAKRYHYLMDLIQNERDIRKKTLVFNTDLWFLEDNKIKPFYDSLKLRPEYQECMDNFVNRYFKNKLVIGVHVRYYDISLPPSDYSKFWVDPKKSLEILKNRLEEIIIKNSRTDYVVFLATNSDIVCDYISKNVNNVVTFNKDFPNIKFNWSLHHVVPENSFKADIIEMVLLTQCDILYRFPPAYSWFSYYGSLYAKEVFNE